MWTCWALPLAAGDISIIFSPSAGELSQIPSGNKARFGRDAWATTLEMAGPATAFGDTALSRTGRFADCEAGRLRRSPPSRVNFTKSPGVVFATRAKVRCAA